MKKVDTVGSALIIIIIVMTTLMICLSNLLFSALFARSIALQRQRNEQRVQATHGLLSLGIDKAQELLHDPTQSTDAKLSWSRWPCGDGQIYQGRVFLLCTDTSCRVQVQLLDGPKVVCALRCCVHKNSLGYTVQDWSFDHDTSAPV